MVWLVLVTKQTNSISGDRAYRSGGAATQIILAVGHVARLSAMLVPARFPAPLHTATCCVTRGPLHHCLVGPACEGDPPMQRHVGALHMDDWAVRHNVRRVKSIVEETYAHVCAVVLEQKSAEQAAESVLT